MWVFNFLSKFTFLFSKKHGHFTLKRLNSFQNENNRKATHDFDPRPLISKLQQEVLKINDIYVSWSSPKSDLGANVLNLENLSFETVNFSQ